MTSAVVEMMQSLVILASSLCDVRMEEIEAADDCRRDQGCPNMTAVGEKVNEWEMGHSERWCKKALGVQVLDLFKSWEDGASEGGKGMSP